MDRIRGNHRSARTPLWLCLSLIGAAAWIYLAQAGAVSAGNARLQTQQQIRSNLTQQHQILLAQLGSVESPAHILVVAAGLGMVPGTWGDYTNQGVTP